MLGASRAINFPFSIKCFVLETEPGRAACSRRVLPLPVRQCPADALGRFPVDLKHPGWTLVVWCNINAYGSDSYSFMPWRPMRPYQVMRCETCWKNGPLLGVETPLHSNARPVQSSSALPRKPAKALIDLENMKRAAAAAAWPARPFEIKVS